MNFIEKPDQLVSKVKKSLTHGGQTGSESPTTLKSRKGKQKLQNNQNNKSVTKSGSSPSGHHGQSPNFSILRNSSTSSENRSPGDKFAIHTHISSEQPSSSSLEEEFLAITINDLVLLPGELAPIRFYHEEGHPIAEVVRTVRRGGELCVVNRGDVRLPEMKCDVNVTLM